MDTKGQGAIEYLLIIAAAILVVAIVILAVTGALSGGQDQGDQAVTDQNESYVGVHDQLTQQQCTNDCEYDIPDSTETCAVAFPDICGKI